MVHNFVLLRARSVHGLLTHHEHAPHLYLIIAIYALNIFLIFLLRRPRVLLNHLWRGPHFGLIAATSSHYQWGLC